MIIVTAEDRISLSRSYVTALTPPGGFPADPAGQARELHRELQAMRRAYPLLRELELGRPVLKAWAAQSLELGLRADGEQVPTPHETFVLWLLDRGFRPAAHTVLNISAFGTLEEAAVQRHDLSAPPEPLSLNPSVAQAQRLTGQHNARLPRTHSGQVLGQSLGQALTEQR